MSIENTAIFLAATMDEMLQPILSDLAAQLETDLSVNKGTILEIAQMLERNMRLADINDNEVDAYKVGANCIYWFNRLKPVHCATHPEMKHFDFLNEFIAFQMGILMIDVISSKANKAAPKQDNIGDALFQQTLHFLRYKELSIDGIYLFLRAALI